jgi:hypothetical protein
MSQTDIKNKICAFFQFLGFLLIFAGIMCITTFKYPTMIDGLNLCIAGPIFSLAGFGFDLFQLRQQKVSSGEYNSLSNSGQDYHSHKFFMNLLFAIGAVAMTVASFIFKVDFPEILKSDFWLYVVVLINASGYCLVAIGAILAFLKVRAFEGRMWLLIIFGLIAVGAILTSLFWFMELFVDVRAVPYWMCGLGVGLLASGFGVNCVITILN